MSEEHEVPQGAYIMIGAPANPMPEERKKRLAEGISRIEGVAFAYVPQMFIPGHMERAEQVICIVISRGYESDVERIMQEVGEVVASVLPSGEYLDGITIFQDSGLVQHIVDTGCCLVVNSPEEHNVYLTGTGKRKA